jgi:hypothetical protein
MLGNVISDSDQFLGRCKNGCNCWLTITRTHKWSMQPIKSDTARRITLINQCALGRVSCLRYLANL